MAQGEESGWPGRQLRGTPAGEGRRGPRAGGRRGGGTGTRVHASRPLVLSGGSLLRALIPCTPELRLALPTASHVVL